MDRKANELIIDKHITLAMLRNNKLSESIKELEANRINGQQIYQIIEYRKTNANYQ